MAKKPFRLDPKAREQSDERPGVPVLGFNDVHERTNGAERLNHLAIGCARLVLVIERLAKRLYCFCIRGHGSPYDLAIRRHAGVGSKLP